MWSGWARKDAIKIVWTILISCLTVLHCLTLSKTEWQFYRPNQPPAPQSSTEQSEHRFGLGTWPAVITTAHSSQDTGDGQTYSLSTTATDENQVQAGIIEEIVFVASLGTDSHELFTVLRHHGQSLYSWLFFGYNIFCIILKESFIHPPVTLWLGLEKEAS